MNSTDFVLIGVPTCRFIWSISTSTHEIPHPVRNEVSTKAGEVHVAPMSRESGSFKGKRRIRGGRSRIRTVMFMIMLSIQCNPVLKASYELLKVAGEVPKLTIIAYMQKLIVILNTMMKNGTCREWYLPGVKIWPKSLTHDNSHLLCGVWV